MSQISLASLATLPFRAALTALRRVTVRQAVLFLGIAAASLVLAYVIAQLTQFETVNGAYPESGWLEGLQSVVLLVAIVVLGVAAARFRSELYAVAVTAGFFTLFLLIRETPQCTSRFYDGGVCLNEPWKVITAVLWTLGLIALLIVKRIDWPDRVEELRLFWVWPALASFLFLVTGETAEQLHFLTTEEMLELAAYINLLLFSFALNLWPGLFDPQRGERA
ncbi:hypothetical protein [Mangrovicella endophytica]|uniref:hypothetical protein n=1 Tax=Mangrovicella endophytica TaxID=2066697 RepID=UPI000C9E0771|nr:hypothetical protein [Mangrovicella endophytica]